HQRHAQFTSQRLGKGGLAVAGLPMHENAVAGRLRGGTARGDDGLGGLEEALLDRVHAEDVLERHPRASGFNRRGVVWVWRRTLLGLHGRGFILMGRPDESPAGTLVQIVDRTDA